MEFAVNQQTALKIIKPLSSRNTAETILHTHSQHAQESGYLRTLQKQLASEEIQGRELKHRRDRLLERMEIQKEEVCQMRKQLQRMDKLQSLQREHEKLVVQNQDLEKRIEKWINLKTRQHQ